MKQALLPFLLAIIIAQAVAIATLVFAPPSIHTQAKKSPRENFGNKDEENQSVIKNGGSRPVAVNIECDPNCARKDPDKKENQSYVAWFYDKLRGDPIILLTTILALANIFLVILVSFQVRDARKSSERQLRAYLFLESTTPTDGTTINPPQPEMANVPGASLLFKNSGQTPAYDIITWAEMKISTFGDESDLIVPRLSEIYTANLGSNGVMPKGVNLKRRLTDIEIEDIKAHRKAIYLYGRVEYRDGFKRKRFSNFRLYWTGSYPPPITGCLFFCQTGNETEESG
jgi:hypothetical protein